MGALVEHGSGGFRPSRDEVVAAFRQLPVRQLVVLGEPGAGKTVLAILFTLEALKARTPGESVPVLLPISSWNPHVEHVNTWLARCLVEDYAHLRGVLRQTGATYQFRHARLQDRLANHGVASS